MKTKLTPLRRGYLIGYRKARARARAEKLNTLADEIEILQQDFAEIERELHHAHDLEDAVVERAMTSDELLH